MTSLEIDQVPTLLLLLLRCLLSRSERVVLPRRLPDEPLSGDSKRDDVSERVEAVLPIGSDQRKKSAKAQKRERRRGGKA